MFSCSCSNDSAAESPQTPKRVITPIVHQHAHVQEPQDTKPLEEVKIPVGVRQPVTADERSDEWAFRRKRPDHSFGKYRYVSKQPTHPAKNISTHSRPFVLSSSKQPSPTPEKGSKIYSGRLSLPDKKTYGVFQLVLNWFQDVPKMELPFVIPTGKQKQILLKGVLEQLFPRVTFDKKITGASRSRPDYVIPGERFTILVECDEFQHRHLTLHQEYQRMKDVLTDLRGLQTKSKCVFLRFNPDSFKTGYNTVHCVFRKDLDGMLVASPDFYLRVCKLIERIRWYLQTPTACDDCDMVIDYLYYDSFFSNKVSHFLKN